MAAQEQMTIKTNKQTKKLYFGLSGKFLTRAAKV